MLRTGRVGSGAQCVHARPRALPGRVYSGAATGGDERHGPAVHEDVAGAAAAVPLLGDQSGPSISGTASVAGGAGWGSAAGGVHAAGLVSMGGARPVG